MRFVIFLFSFVIAFHVNGQSLDKSTERYQTILNLVSGYNNEDYKKMEHCFSSFGRLIISKKRLEHQYKPFHNANGSATIVDVTIIYGNSYTVELNTAKNPKLRTFWQVNFNDKADIIGLGFGYPSLYYPKVKGNLAKYEHDTLQASFDEIVLRYVRNQPMKGINGSIFVSMDTFSYSRSVGFSYLHDSLKNNEETKFLLASCTKPLTALAILILVQQGKLSLENKVSDFIPEFPYPTVTVENLLSHTSGIPNYQHYVNKYLSKTDFITNQDILSLYTTHKIPSHFQPNQRFEYSNTNYILLAILIEIASKQRYHEFLSSEIFNPLKMSNTLVYNTRRFKKDILANYAFGYVYDTKNQTYEIPDSMEKYNYVVKQDRMYGDDNVSSTAIDMSKFLSIFQEEGNLLSHTLKDKMIERHTLNSGKKSNYGLGIMISEGDDYEKVIYHTGSWPGYYTLILSIPKHKINVVILTNNQYENYMHLADELINVLLMLDR